MPHSLARRLGAATVLALLAGVAGALPAAAQARCAAPDDVGWRSCLTVSHRAADDAPDLTLTKARPRLVERFARCPAQRVARRVVVRTGDGERLGAATVRSRCADGVVRWVAVVELDVSVREGAVVRSFWSGVDDSEASAPRVKVEPR
jgi:hypothetical protein